MVKNVVSSSDLFSFLSLPRTLQCTYYQDGNPSCGTTVFLLSSLKNDVVPQPNEYNLSRALTHEILQLVYRTNQS